MLKKIVLGLLMSTVMLTASASDSTVTEHEKAIGYQSAKAGAGFPVGLFELGNYIGKRDSFELAFNKDKNKDTFVDTYSTDNKVERIYLAKMAPNDVIKKEKLTFSSSNDNSYLKIDTTGPLTLHKIAISDYNVIYTVGNGYLYKIVIETRYKNKENDENYDREDEELSRKQKADNYLTKNGYEKVVSIFFSERKYKKGDIIVDVEQPSTFKEPYNYFVISIENDKLLQEYQKAQNIEYMKKVKANGDNFDKILK